MAKVLVLTTTYPLDKSDVQPRFVQFLSEGVAREHDVWVLAPTIQGTRKASKEGRLRIVPFRYFLKQWEVLCGGDGVLENLKRRPLLYAVIPFLLLVQILCARKLIRRHDIDVVHAHWLLPQGLTALIVNLTLWGRKPRILLTSHGGDLFALNGMFASYLKRWVLERVDQISVVSQAMKQKCVDELKVPADKVIVAPMGVELAATFVPKGCKKADSLVFVGRMAEKKGVDVLLHALSILKSKGINYRANIVGGGSLLEEYKKLAIQMDIDPLVTFHGSLPNQDVVSFLQEASIAVFPFRISRDGDQEGLGLTMVEAHGCECLVLASELPAVKDVIEHGVYGFLVEPESPQALAKAIEKALKLAPENSDRIRFAGREHAKKKFDWQFVAHKYSSMISELGAHRLND